MTAAQYRHYLHYLKTHRALDAKLKRKEAAKAHHATGICMPDSAWVTGGNDKHGTCVMTAIANSLLLETGIRVPDAEIIGYGEGLAVDEALALVMCHGLGGIQLKAHEPAGLRWAALPGMLLSLTLPFPLENHAAMSAGGCQMVSWGMVMPVEGIVEEAWCLEWR